MLWCLCVCVLICCCCCCGAGSGDKLGDIPRTSFQISKMKREDLKPLHTLLFDRPGKVGTPGHIWNRFEIKS